MATQNRIRAAAKRALYRADFKGFAAEQLWIKRREGGPLTTLQLDTAQLLLDAKIEADFARRGYCRIVTLKGRQSGWSTYAQGRLFHAAALRDNYDTLLIALDEHNTTNIFSMAHLFYEKMDADVKPMVRFSSKRELLFANPDRRLALENPGLNSRMSFQSSSNVLAGTGVTRQALHASEIAKWLESSVRDLMTSLMPAIHPVPGTMVIMESTAFSGGDYFRAMCEKAREGDGEYVWCFVPWWLNCQNTMPLLKGEKITLTSEEKSIIKFAAKGQPRDDVPPFDITIEQIKWARTKAGELDDEGEFEQEYPRSFGSAWLSRDFHVFDFDRLRVMEKELRAPLRLVEVTGGLNMKPAVLTIEKGGRLEDDRDYIAIFDEPRDGVKYDMGVDVAAGIEGGDWSVAEVIRRDTGEQVAEYHKHVDPVDLTDELYWLGKFYNTAHMIIEVNTYGLATSNHMSRLTYPNIYIWRRWDNVVPKLSNLTGFRTTWESKKILVGTARHLFVHGRIIPRSRILWTEMCNFIRLNEETYRGSNDNWDDCVMAMMLALQGGYDESFDRPLTAAKGPDGPTGPYMPGLVDAKAGKMGQADRLAEQITRELRGMS